MCTHKQTIYERFRNAWEEDIINNSEGEKITQVTDKPNKCFLYDQLVLLCDRKVVKFPQPDFSFYTFLHVYVQIKRSFF